MKMVEAKKDPPSCIQAMEGGRCQTKVLVAKNPLSRVLSEGGVVVPNGTYPFLPCQRRHEDMPSCHTDLLLLFHLVHSQYINEKVRGTSLVVSIFIVVTDCAMVVWQQW